MFTDKIKLLLFYFKDIVTKSSHFVTLFNEYLLCQGNPSVQRKFTSLSLQTRQIPSVKVHRTLCDQDTNQTHSAMIQLTHSWLVKQAVCFP